MIKPSYIIILILFILVGTFQSCKQEENAAKLERYDLSDIQKKGKLVALTDYNSTSYFIYRGTPMGFQYDLLKILAKELDLELELKVSNNIDDALTKLSMHECDILAMNLTITNHRKKEIGFLNALGSTRQVLVQRKPENWRVMASYNIEKHLIRNQLELGNKTVHVKEHSAFAQRLAYLSDEIGDSIKIEEVEYYDTEQLITLVNKGEIDYAVADENTALLHQSYYPNLDVQTPISFPQRYAWATSLESTQLQEKINAWLKQFVKTAHYAIIYKKYFKTRAASARSQSDYISVTGGKISDFDPLIRKYSETINWDWRLLASLIYQESRFDPYIKSWAGAYGLMQLMPQTAKRFGASKNSTPEVNIMAGVKFIQWLDRQFINKIEDPNERIKFILASYNAGKGHVDDARRLAEANGRDPNVWDDNVAFFILNKSNPEYYDSKYVKHGHLRGHETFNYVKKIMKRFDAYKTVIQ